jgi:hypothetical protein
MDDSKSLQGEAGKGMKAKSYMGDVRVPWKSGASSPRTFIVSENAALKAALSRESSVRNYPSLESA